MSLPIGPENCVSRLVASRGRKECLTNIPILSHTHRCPKNTKEECSECSNGWGKTVRLVVVLHGVTAKALSEDEMLRDGNSFVDGKPIPNHQHKVLQNGFEMGVSGNGDRDIDTCADESPQEAWYPLCVVGHDLQREGERVNVRAVVANDAECQNDDTELSKSSHTMASILGEEDFCEETTHVVVCVCFSVGWIAVCCCSDCNSEHYNLVRIFRG